MNDIITIPVVLSSEMLFGIPVTYSSDEDSDVTDEENIVTMMLIKSRKIKKPQRIENYIEATISGYTKQEFQQHFRVTIEAYEQLLQTVGPYLMRQAATGRSTVQVEKQLLSVIWILVTPDSYSADSDYGATNDIIDMPTETYDKIKNEFLNDLAACDILKIPLLTIGQRNNEQWDKERNNRLTASNFGRIINMKCTTNTANAVKDILYRVGLSKFKKLPEPLQWGIDNEEKAKEKFEQITGIKVVSCGFFVDKEKKFLGATPDGLVGSNGIVEIKCPFSARNINIKTAIEQKLIKYLEIDFSR
ncbi:hypothetical protein TcasGA2_TC008599 [Tribolium castaneum]|uniref:YqaJ viral recombinase domain-containing protein n=1 Tax=Tribolium castaneum TaxID=7070 RepID=D6WTY5_TRICA|nr:hypothetical protein TcasGA2_TC008599 [Tribolium castaneum]